MLKVDVQGFEHSVLDGARESLQDISLIEIEMGLTKLYENGSSVHDLLPRLKAMGYDVILLESGFVDAATGQVLDIDMLMGRALIPNAAGEAIGNLDKGVARATWRPAARFRVS